MHKDIIHDRPEPGDTLLILSGPFAGRTYQVHRATPWQFRLTAGKFLYVDWRDGKILYADLFWGAVIVEKHGKKWEDDVLIGPYEVRNEYLIVDENAT